MWLIITLIIVGILLLVAELVLLPGISVAGIGAFLSLAVAAVYGFFLYGILGGSVVLAAIIIVAVAAVVISLRANTWQRLSLKSTIDATSTPTAEQNDIRIGQRGETLTRLARWVRCGSGTLPSRPSRWTPISIPGRPSR